ncbi:MAG TPA: sigma 54-interacting transcriptional regulator [Terriglobia bacterium]|nr:sigma 54-interacting transcriptional regulator [Terriglobia bacterium]
MNATVQPAFDTSLTERYRALFRVSRTLMSHRNQDDLPQTLSSELRRVLNFYYLCIGLYDPKAHEVRLRAFDETGAPISIPQLATEETLTWWVYQEQRPLVIASVEQETRFPASVRVLKQYGIGSVCVLPLTTAHRRIGVLSVGNKEPDAFSKDEICFLTLVANQVALAIDDAFHIGASERVKEELQRERDRLQLLLDITNGVVSNLDQREVLRAISGAIRRVMECDGAAVLLPDCRGGQLNVYALDFPKSQGLCEEGKVVPSDTSPAGTAFQSGKIVVMSEAELSRVAPNKCEMGIKCMCFVPLVSRNRSVGVLTLARMGKTIFSEDEISFLTQVAGQMAIAVENACAYRQISDLKDQLAREKVYLEDEIRSELNFEEIVGESSALRQVLGQVETVAPTDSTVLIYGETGTGKELIARAIHKLSVRQSGAFVKLNCAAIPTGLLESELFGHEKGAFTGAVTQRIGRFELANRGTMFLDEIGEIPLELQPKLLRVLQEREFERLGSTRTLISDARLVAATNRDLASLVEEQRFRADLFYRLNVFPVQVPPLRERPEDIPPLVRHFVQQFSRRMNKTIDTILVETMNALTRYYWPGNVRELQNVIERAVILTKGPALSVALSDLKRRMPDNNASTKDTLEEAERKHILAVLEATNWVVGGQNGAAVRLGLNRSTLQFRMNKLGLARPRPVSSN